MTQDTQKQHGALYLRVRPQEFDEVLGNDAAVQTLQQALQTVERQHVGAVRFRF